MNLQDVLRETANRRKRLSNNAPNQLIKRARTSEEDGSIMQYRYISCDDHGGRIPILYPVLTLNKVEFTEACWQGRHNNVLGTLYKNRAEIEKRANSKGVSLGDVAASVQHYKTNRVLSTSFIFDFAWLGRNFPNWKDAKVDIFHGIKMDTYELKQLTDEARPYLNNVTYHKVKLPSPFSTYHGKIIVQDMIYDGPVRVLRVVIASGNFCSIEWTHYQNTVYIVDLPAYIKKADGNVSVEERTPEQVVHGENWLKYFLKYFVASVGYVDGIKDKNSVRAEITEFLSEFDFSYMPLNVHPIISIGDRDFDPTDHYGRSAVTKIISDQKDIGPDGVQVIAQCSSLGTWEPPNMRAWLKAFGLNSTKERDDFLLVLPSASDVIGSSIGFQACDRLPLRNKTIALVNEYISYYGPNISDVERDIERNIGPYNETTDVISLWGEYLIRSKVIAHAKCYLIRQNRKLRIFISGSANMSLAAWGKMTKSNKLKLNNFEFSVAVVGTNEKPLEICSLGRLPINEDYRISNVVIPFRPVLIQRGDPPFTLDLMENTGSPQWKRLYEWLMEESNSTTL